MKKYFLSIAAIIMAVGFTAFIKPQPVTSVINGKIYTDYWYTYNGPDQSVAERSKKTNYTSPAASKPLACNSTVNECAVKVSLTGTAPSDISTLNVTFDGTTGFPNGGTNFLENSLKP